MAAAGRAPFWLPARRARRSLCAVSPGPRVGGQNVVHVAQRVCGVDADPDGLDPFQRDLGGDGEAAACEGDRHFRVTESTSVASATSCSSRSSALRLTATGPRLLFGDRSAVMTKTRIAGGPDGNKTKPGEPCP